MRIGTLVAMMLALLAGSFTFLLADGACAEFVLLPGQSAIDPNCLSSTWLAWMTAGQNDPNNPTSNSWGGKLLLTMLDDGLPGARTSCGFNFFDKDGEQLSYSVAVPGLERTDLSRGVGGNLSPGQTIQADLASPLSPEAGPIGGPLLFFCRSADPATLRNKIVALSAIALYSPDGLKLAEVSERVKPASSNRWAFPLVEGGDGNNWEHTGVAITNTTVRQKAPSGVTVRISITDQQGKKGPSRDITLKPFKYDIPPEANFIPGETKAFALWTLFGESPVEGNALFAPYGNRTKRAQIVYGTVTVESLDPGSTIAVFATRMFGETGLTAVPVSPVPAP